MRNYKTPLSFFVILISLIFIVIPFVYPVDGGFFFIFIGVLWFCVQLWRYTVFQISKAFLFFVVLVIYLIGYIQFSKPIPITYILVQRILIFLMLAILMYTSLRSNSDRIPWENALIVLGLIVSVWSVIEIIDWYYRYSITTELQVLPKPQVAYRLQGSFFGHPNPLAGFLNFVWPIALLRLIRTQKKSKKILWGISLTLFFITIFYTNSRGALMGAMVSLLIIFILVIMGKQQRVRSLFSWENKQQLFVLFVGFSIILLLSLGVLWRANITGQLLSRSFSGRGTIWKYSWDAFLENPIIGQGIAAFPISYTKFAQLPPGDFAPSAHNLWLQISVDYGVIGFVFISILMIVFVFYGIRALWSESSTSPEFSIAYIAGCGAFLAQQTIDYMFVTLSYLVIFVVILVLLVRYTIQFGEWGLSRRNYAVLGILLISTLASFQSIVLSKITHFSEKSYRQLLANDEQWDLLESQICQSADSYRNNALYKFDCSMVIAQQLALPIQEPTRSDQMLEKAIFYQQAGYDLNPYWMTQEANLAVLYWLEGDRITAIEYMEHTATSAPMDALFWLNFGWMNEQIGNQSAALNAYKRALRITPIINRSIFLQHSSLISQAAEDLKGWIESEHLWDDWYDGSRHDRAKYDQDYWKGVIALSIGQIDLAIKSLETSLENGQTHPSLYTYLAYAYELNGQTELAFRVAQDIALLSNNRIRSLGNPTELSLIASLLLKNDETDLAYELFSEAFEIINTKITYKRYYPRIYAQQILLSDISPWMIQSHLILTDTQDNWTWFAEEAAHRDDAQLSEDVKLWLMQLDGISRISD